MCVVSLGGWQVEHDLSLSRHRVLLLRILQLHVGAEGVLKSERMISSVLGSELCPQMAKQWVKLTMVILSRDSESIFMKSASIWSLSSLEYSRALLAMHSLKMSLNSSRVIALFPSSWANCSCSKTFWRLS